MSRGLEKSRSASRGKNSVLKTGSTALAVLAATMTAAVPGAIAKEKSKYISMDAIEEKVEKRLVRHKWQKWLDGVVSKKLVRHSGGRPYPNETSPNTGGREYPGEPSNNAGGRSSPDNRHESYENYVRPMVEDRRRHKTGPLDLDSRDAAYGLIDPDTGEITFTPFNPKTMAYNGVIRMFKLPGDPERLDFFDYAETKDDQGNIVPLVDQNGDQAIIGQRFVSAQPLVSPAPAGETRR